ncbi:MAG TPA: hypothetical protein VGM64_04870 [Lacunisphaera sp.]|jgi:hypothetical protein
MRRSSLVAVRQSLVAFASVSVLSAAIILRATPEKIYQANWASLDARPTPQ